MHYTIADIARKYDIPYHRAWMIVRTAKKH